MRKTPDISDSDSLAVIALCVLFLFLLQAFLSYQSMEPEIILLFNFEFLNFIKIFKSFVSTDFEMIEYLHLNSFLCLIRQLFLMRGSNRPYLMPASFLALVITLSCCIELFTASLQMHC